MGKIPSIVQEKRRDNQVEDKLVQVESLIEVVRDWEQKRQAF